MWLQGEGAIPRYEKGEMMIRNRLESHYSGVFLKITREESIQQTKLVLVYSDYDE